VEYFPQVDKKRKAINFNYHRKSKLINCKYRDGDKNFRLVGGAELIFYGLDNIEETESCVIVEGEIDALSLTEAGVHSVVSVPNGASKGSQKLQYLDNSYQYFENKKEITIFTDNDAAGIALRNELARRLGHYRCKYVDPGAFKDANDILTQAGAKTLLDTLKMAKSFPIEGVLDLEANWDNVLNFSEHGIPNYSLGLAESDNYIKFTLGEWSVLTGIPNSGKSDICDQICVNMALMHDFRVAMFAPESYPYEGHIKRIANKINQTNCTTAQLNDSKDFIKDHFYFVKIDLKNLTLKAILDKFRQLVLQRGINICIIDPWNMLDHSEQRDYSYIGRILSEITQFCQQTNTHLILVAHPRKMQMENGQYVIPSPYDISGSSDFFNKAYNCLTAYRVLGQKTEYQSDAVQIHVQKVKRKENGQQGYFTVAPDFRNGGVYKSIENKTRLTVSHDLAPF
jgi:twinkle protein